MEVSANCRFVGVFMMSSSAFFASGGRALALSHASRPQAVRLANPGFEACPVE